MTIVSPMGQLRPVFADKNGKRLSGGKVYTYEPGTLTPKATYTDALNLIPNTNPIDLDKYGEADIFLNGDYRIRVVDRHGVLIDDYDNLMAWATKRYLDSALSGFASGANKFYPTLAGANADIVNIAVNQVVNIGELENGGLWFKESTESTTLTKAPYDAFELAKQYSNQKQVVQEQYINDLFAAQTQNVENIINQQGVSLQQLDDYYNYLMGRLAQIAVQGGWEASFVVDASGENQQQVNDRIGNTWHEKPLGYSINDRVMLDNGDIVKSTIANNTANPNIDLTGWDFSNNIKPNDLLNFFTAKELKAWLVDQENYDVSDILIRYQTLASGGEMLFPQGIFRITKAIPSSKNWVGVRGGYLSRGTKIIVDNAVAIAPVIPLVGSVGIELKDIRFEDKQSRTHTLYKQHSYQVKHSGLRIEKFLVGIDESGTFDSFEDCYFVNNGTGIKERAIAETGIDVQSTVWNLNRCYFTYNDIGIDTSRNYNNGANEDLINILLTSCGFEQNRIGYNAPTRNWYLTFQNCWFEANSEYGLYAPNSDVLEINTRHNANSPKSVGVSHTSILPYRTELDLIKLNTIEPRDGTSITIGSDVKFPTLYKEVSNVNELGKIISQSFSNPTGSSKASIRFYRNPGPGSVSNSGAGIRFSTQFSAAASESERWELNGAGHFEPLTNNTYNIGSSTNKLAAVYTQKTMYNATVGDFYGGGSPEGVVAAGIGSTYRRVDGGSGTSFYVKESGISSTGWVAK